MLVFLSLTFCLHLGADTYLRYFKSTYNGMERMRHPKLGLLVDSTLKDFRVLNPNTSPTNIALDILVQLEAENIAPLKTRARQNLQRLLKTLSMLPRHESGLFFNRYSPEGRVTEWYVSSVDNMHLYFALWVVHELERGTSLGRTAFELLKDVDFSPLRHEPSGLFVGGLYFKEGSWVPEEWKYDYLGSEGRILYSLGHALGLLPDFRLSLRNLHFEIKGAHLLLWDGGAFQLLLPRLLLDEAQFSKNWEVFYQSFARLMLTEGERRGLLVPAAHSACQLSSFEYSGKAGVLAVVASFNSDIHDMRYRDAWESVFTPHAAFLGATVLPDSYAQHLKTAEGLGTKDMRLYTEDEGWLDGLHVRGPRAGEIVPVYLALDQAMIALASAQISFKGGRGQQAIQRNEEVQRKLKNYFNVLDHVILAP